MRLTGDFRYRYEEIEPEDGDERHRSRIRARAAIAVDAVEGIELGLGLATGGDSPTSSTQTLGDGGSKKPVTLDLAYVDWSPHRDWHLVAGKFRNPLFQVPSQTLLWDDEWRPEGMAVRYRSGGMFATLLGTWLESDSAAEHREWAAGGHAGIIRQLGAAELTTGAGYFDFGTAGKGTFYGDETDFAGNSFACIHPPLDEPEAGAACTYLLDYREVEAFAMLSFDRHAFDTSVYGHYVHNLDADRFDDGWTLGTRLGSAWRGMPVRLDYFYRALEADAVFGQLTDSDFGGGGSDAEGHYLKASLWVTDAWQLSITGFDDRVDADAGGARDYDRLQLNADFRY